MESRNDLLHWVNILLQIGYTKIEQMGSGAAYCQIMDVIYHDVPLTKVNCDAIHEYEYVNNFKILQGVFSQHNVTKTIPIERLVKSKFQDNLEFMQWMKKFFDTHFSGNEYDAVARRNGIKTKVNKVSSSSSSFFLPLV